MKNKSKSRNEKRWYKGLLKSFKCNEKFSKAKERFSNFLELPQEVMFKVTKITAIENDSIHIEGYKNIIDYYDDYIKIKANNMDILIDGKNLDIKEITDTDLVIEGKIYSLNYQN